jgi:hypothetical protein
MTKPIPLEVLESEFDDSKKCGYFGTKHPQTTSSFRTIAFREDDPFDSSSASKTLKRSSARESRAGAKEHRSREGQAPSICSGDRCGYQPNHADSFVVHSPNEVLEFVRDKAAERS